MNPLSLKAMKKSIDDIPKKIYKYCSLSAVKNDPLNEAKFFSLQQNKVWFSPYPFLNDPFEGHNTVFPDKNRFDEILSGINYEEKHFLLTAKKEFEGRPQQYTQSSFSKICDNAIMWAHYANNYFGYCIEYEVKKTNNLIAVQYFKKRVVIDWIDASKKKQKEYNKNARILEKTLNKWDCVGLHWFFYLNAIKSKEWEYEQEIRAIDWGENPKYIKAQNYDIRSFGLKVSKIIIGFRCVHQTRLKQLADYLKIPCYIIQPSYANNDYKLIQLPF